MGTKTLAGFDTVFVDDTQSAPTHVGWVVVAGKGKAVKRFQPTVVGIASVKGSSNFVHGVYLVEN
jgi:hypothetical protein